MEEVIKRFPHFSKGIFDSLDNQSLEKCNQVSKSWQTFIKNEKYYWIRIIKSYMEKANKKHANNPKRWKIFKDIRFDLVKKFAVSMQYEFEVRHSNSCAGRL